MGRVPGSDPDFAAGTVGDTIEAAGDVPEWPGTWWPVRSTQSASSSVSRRRFMSGHLVLTFAQIESPLRVREPRHVAVRRQPALPAGEPMAVPA